MGALCALCGCQTLPEGSRRPELTIEQVSLQVQDGKPGFAVDCSLMHDSLEALPLNASEITVFLNGTQAGKLQLEENGRLLPAHQQLSLHYFVPANLPAAASYSLQYNRMLKIPSSVLVHLTFDQDNLSFNPNATFEGLISHD